MPRAKWLWFNVVKKLSECTLQMQVNSEEREAVGGFFYPYSVFRTARGALQMEKCVIYILLAVMLYDTQKTRHSGHTFIWVTLHKVHGEEASPTIPAGESSRTMHQLVCSWASGCGVCPGNTLSEIRAGPKQTFIFHSYAQFSVEGTEYRGQRGARHALAMSWCCSTEGS